MKILTNNFEETQKIGEEFAQRVKGGETLLLYGDLGAGKTTFLQGFAKGLHLQRRIISPTFIIMRSYAVDAIPNVHMFYHIDLYRTQTEHDREGLGIPEILKDKNAIVAIEWPEKLGSIMPKRAWKLIFTTVEENVRSITIEKV